MPVCAGFGVIDEYLSIKDQIDAGLLPEQLEVPDLDKQKLEIQAMEAADTGAWYSPHSYNNNNNNNNNNNIIKPTTTTNNGPVEPKHFLGLEEGSWFLESMDGFEPTAPSAPTGPTPGFWPSMPSSRFHPGSYSPPPSPPNNRKDIVKGMAGAGCTVIEHQKVSSSAKLTAFSPSFVRDNGYAPTTTTTTPTTRHHNHYHHNNSAEFYSTSGSEDAADITDLDNQPTSFYSDDSNNAATAATAAGATYLNKFESVFGGMRSGAEDFTTLETKCIKLERLEDSGSDCHAAYQSNGQCLSPAAARFQQQRAACHSLTSAHALTSGSDMDPNMESVVIESIRSEILHDSRRLGISENPHKWTREDTLTWVRHILKVNHLSLDWLAYFNVTGAVLCQMESADYMWRAPQAGHLIQQHLDIWKMVAMITPSTPQKAVHTSFDFSSAASPSSSSSSRAVPSASPVPSPDSTSLDSSTCSLTSLTSGGQHGGHHSGHGSPFDHTASSSNDGMYDEDDDYSIGLHNNTTTTTTATTAPTSAHHHHNIPSHVPSVPHSPAGPPRVGRTGGKQTIHLWQFLKELLEDSDTYRGCIKWQDRAKGIFKIEDSNKVAKLWGRRKNRPAMNYDKLSRSVRQYYKKGIIKKTETSKRLVYQFCQPPL